LIGELSGDCDVLPASGLVGPTALLLDGIAVVFVGFPGVENGRDGGRIVGRHASTSLSGWGDV
jgi:hypothetical protein